MAELRKVMREVGGEYKIYKNTLVRLAAKELDLEIEDLLVGPTALAFVTEKADGSNGDAAALAKALKEFAKNHDAMVIKGGLLDGELLSSEQIAALAKLPTREVLLAQLAGAMAAPMQQFAGLLNALPQNLAYALKALIEQGGGNTSEAEAIEAPVEDAEATADAEPAEATEAEATEASVDEVAAEEAAPETDQTEEAAAEETEEG
jgi:large subunit ribosomal protein L10